MDFNKNGSKTGPYVIVWPDICTESIPEALGSLWDASPSLKPSKHLKGFMGLLLPIPADLPLKPVSTKVVIPDAEVRPTVLCWDVLFHWG